MVQDMNSSLGKKRWLFFIHTTFLVINRSLRTLRAGSRSAFSSAAFPATLFEGVVEIQEQIRPTNFSLECPNNINRRSMKQGNSLVKHQEAPRGFDQPKSKT